MQDVVHFDASLAHRFEIEQIDLPKIHLRKNLAQVLALSRGKIVDSSYLVALCQDCPRQRRPDEARNSRD
jgi:phosphoheptose isomerase